ncbi:hypothetical protein [Flavobacterium sp.]|uniref:hypothetical protein n=1 Tax=Flavobacterium sp. TaxID=239 RepID=UPI0039E2452A
MKRILKFLFLLSILKVNSQNSFEGIINFKVKIETHKDSIELNRKLIDKYGEDISMYYFKNASLSVNYLDNNGKILYYSKFSPTTGIMTTHFKNKGVENVKKSSTIELAFLEKRKIANENIIGKDCECFEYKTEDRSALIYKLTYCFSSKTPKIDYRNFKECKDFFMKEYYETSERPYLKYIIENKFMKVTWEAQDIQTKEIDQSIYNNGS